MKNKKICLIASSAPLYRKMIYTYMGKVLGCDFILGAGPTKQMNIYDLPNKVIPIYSKYFFGTSCYLDCGAVTNSKDYETLILCMGIRSITEWLILFLALFRRQKTYIWSHGWLGKETPLKRFLGRIYYGMANGVFIYNERSTILMKKEGIKPRKLHTIYNSLDYDAQLILRQKVRTLNIYHEHFGNENRNIVFIGRLTSVKRFDLLLDAVALLKKQGEIVNVTFIGDGVERENMERRVNYLDIRAQVWFYGACYDEKTNAEMISNADLCVSPGNIGLTAIHVMMFGCPAITNDDFDHQMPEFEAIRDGKTGTFFKANDSNSLADAISKWFKQHASNRDEVRKACYGEIDCKWNPHNQIRIFKSVLCE